MNSRRALLGTLLVLGAALAGCTGTTFVDEEPLTGLAFDGTLWIRGGFAAGGDACALGAWFAPDAPEPRRVFARHSPEGDLRAHVELPAGRLRGPIGFAIDGGDCYAALALDEGRPNATLRILRLDQEGRMEDVRYPEALAVAFVFTVQDRVAYAGLAHQVHRFLLEPPRHDGPSGESFARIMGAWGIPSIDPGPPPRLWHGQDAIPLEQVREEAWPVRRVGAAGQVFLAGADGPEDMRSPTFVAFGRDGRPLHAFTPATLAGDVRNPLPWGPPELPLQILPHGRLFIATLPVGAPWTDSIWIGLVQPEAGVVHEETVPVADLTSFAGAAGRAGVRSPLATERWLGAYPLDARVDGDRLAILVGGPTEGARAGPRIVAWEIPEVTAP